MEITKTEFNFAPYGELSKGAFVNLGCGPHQYTNLINIDLSPKVHPDKVMDLFSFPINLPDNYISFAMMHHFLEHIPKHTYFNFMTELNRICCNGAIIDIISPYYSSIRAMQDPTHEIFVSEATPLYFSSKWRQECHVEQYLDEKFNWELLHLELGFNPPWDKKSDEARQFAIQHYINVVADIKMVLKVIK